MKRSDLVKCLEGLSPALAQTDLIPALTHYWFRKDTVMAFNDVIAIAMPCKVGVECAVPSLLLRMLAQTRAEDVTFELKDDNLHVVAGAGKMKFPTLPPKVFVFEMPQVNSKRALQMKGAPLRAAFKACALSQTNDSSSAEALGITLIPDDGFILMFSTDNKTVSFAELENKGAPIERIILPWSFCNAIVALTSDEDNVLLEIRKDSALCSVPAADIFCRLIVSSHPMPFLSIRDKHYPEKAKFIDVPKELDDVLARACLITDTTLSTALTQITANGKSMSFFSESERGSVRDKIDIGASLDVQLSVTPKKLRLGLELYDRMFLSDRSVILKRKDSPAFFMVAAGK